MIKPLVRLAGSVLVVAVFAFAATALYVQAAQLPTAAPLAAQDDPLQNTGMFVQRDHPVARHPLIAGEGRQAQSEAVNLTNWHYTGRPIPSQFQIF